MSTEAYKQKARAQDALALHQVQPLLEQLVCELTLTRPADPAAALLARLDELDAHYSAADGDALMRGGVASTPPSRVLTPRRLVCVYGVRGAGKTTQCAMAAAACNGVTLSPSKLLELATKDRDGGGGGGQRSDYARSHTSSRGGGGGGGATRARKTTVVLQPSAELRQAAHEALARGAQYASTELLTQLLALCVTQTDEARRAAATTTTTTTNTTAAAADDRSVHAPVTFLLDDYPQTLEQAMALEASVGAMTCAIELRCPRAVALRRAGSNAPSPTAASGGSGVRQQQQQQQQQQQPQKQPRQEDEDEHEQVAVRVQTLGEYWKARGVRRVVDASPDAQTCARAIRALLNE